MIEITHSSVIDRPVAEVFAYAGDQTNDERWATVFWNRARLGRSSRQGSTLVQVARFLGRRIEAHCEVIEYEHDRRVALKMVAGPNEGTHERTFEPADGGTRLTLLTRGDSTGPFRLADPVLSKVAAKQMASDVSILTELLETHDVDLYKLA